MYESTSIAKQNQSMPAALANEVMPVQESLESETELVERLPIQLKLSIGSPDDPLEHEADAMADQVMRMPETSFIQRKSNCSCSDYDDEHIHLKPLASRITPFIQRKDMGAGAVNDSVSGRIKSSMGGGNSMDGGAKSFMESRFGADFSNVRIHSGNEASGLNSELNAKAFTVGNNIYFNNGQYQPGSNTGKHLLAHELTHVVQQNGISQKSAEPVSDTPGKIQRKGAKDQPKEKPPAIARISELLSTNILHLDFAVTDNDARQALTILEGLGPIELLDTVMKMRLSGKWNTLLNELPDSDWGRLTEIQIKIDTNAGYLMLGDTLKLEGWLPEERQLQKFDVYIYDKGIYLPMLEPPIQVIALLPQDAVNFIAKSLEDAKVCPWTALSLAVTSRGIKYGTQSGPVRGELPFNAKSISLSPLSLSKQKSKKLDQFWAFYKTVPKNDERSLIAAQFYFAQLNKSLINFEKPEELWKWALDESDKKTAPKREFLSWQSTFKRQWEDAVKNKSDDAPEYYEEYTKYTEWINTHTEDDFKRYDAKKIAMQTIDQILSKKWKQQELDIRKKILEKRQESPIDSPKFGENLDKVIVIIESKILRIAPAHTAEDKTHGVGYLILPSDREKMIRRVIADEMLHDYLQSAVNGPEVTPDFFVNHWLVTHPKQLDALKLAQAYPYVEKYGVPIEIPAYETVIEVGIGFIPIVGEIVGVYEVIGGEDLFGRPLSPEERAILGVLILLPAAAKIFKVGKGVVTASRLARDYRMTPREADAALRAFTGIAPGTKGEKLLREVEADFKSGKPITDPNKLRSLNLLFEEMGVTEKSTADALKSKAANPFADLTEAEIDAHLENFEVEKVKGIKQPTIAGKAVKTRQIERLDIEDLFLRPGETQRQALQRVKTAIGKKINETPLAGAWNRARNTVLNGRDVTSFSREEMIGKGGIYDQVRDAFWDEVRQDEGATRFLENAGFDFTSGRAPILQVTSQGIGVQELRISLDHVDEKAIGENWLKAIDADNLQMEFQNPNSFRESVQKKFPDLRE